MDMYDRDEPTELELEEQRAGYQDDDPDDVFDNLQAATWLSGIAPIDHGGEPPEEEEERDLDR